MIKWLLSFNLLLLLFTGCQDNQILKKKYNNYVSCLYKVRAKNQITEEQYLRLKENPQILKKEAESTLLWVQSQKRSNYSVRDCLKDSLMRLKKEQSVKAVGKFKIKRVWLNDDVLPWTYESYTHIYLRMSGGYSGIMSRFGRIGGRIGSSYLSVKGNAKGEGDNKLSYINVVLSDNSFYQFMTRHNPEWLLVREGDMVERKENDILVPLFKNK